jgi:hypothetical protein
MQALMFDFEEVIVPTNVEKVVRESSVTGNNCNC